MLIFVGLGENSFNQKTVKSVALNFFVSCTAGAKKSPLSSLNKFSLLKTKAMLLDTMV